MDYVRFPSPQPHDFPWLIHKALVPESLAPAFCFSIYSAILRHNHNAALPAGPTFAALTIIGLISSQMMTLLVNIPSLAATVGSFDRIQKYLQASEVPSKAAQAVGTEHCRRDDEVAREKPQNLGEEEKVGDLGNASDNDSLVASIEDADFAFAPQLPTVLKDIHLRIQKLQIILLLGPVGSGKTSLLLALLGELSLVRGKVHLLPIEVAWCQQRPWITDGSIKNAIIAGAPYELQWYQEVVHCCDLERDIDDLQRDHEFKLSEQGSNVSGGQRQRLAC